MLCSPISPLIFARAQAGGDGGDPGRRMAEPRALQVRDDVPGDFVGLGLSDELSEVLVGQARVLVGV